MKNIFRGMIIAFFALASLNPLWAMDGKKLTDGMFRWANIWGVVFTAYQNADNPHYPVSWDLIEKKVQEIEQIRDGVKVQINQIASLEEISETRNILYYFKAVTSFEQNVRQEVSKMVDDRERFLKAQQE
ncbi:MAG TPA: hypothetical protein VIV61_03815 [Candidatus Ozemobacteraceae bacterium]